MEFSPYSGTYESFNQLQVAHGHIANQLIECVLNYNFNNVRILIDDCGKVAMEEYSCATSHPIRTKELELVGVIIDERFFPARWENGKLVAP